MPTTPTDLLARLRAVLTAAEAMTPPPVAWSRYRDGVFIGIFEGPTDPRTVHDPGPRFEFRPLVEAPAPLTDADLTMRVARAIFDARCPGIRWTDEDAPAYLAAAKAAIEGMEAPAPLTVGDGCPGCAGALAGLVDTICDTCRAAAVDAFAGPLTVGAALADPRVQDGSHVVEYDDGGMWRQLRSATREALSTRAFLQGFRGSPPERAMLWSAWMSTGVDNRDSAEVWAEEYALPCRLVPLTDADRDPATRGPL